jgi:aminopeptidase YwaD
MAHRRDDNLIATWGLGRELDAIPSVSIGFADFSRLHERFKQERLVGRLRVCGKVRAGGTQMVIGRVPGMGQANGVIVVVGSHHETVPGSPGANDNGTGLAGMLELARHFHGRPLEHHDLLLVATGGEESGHWANAAWVEGNSEFLERNAKGVLVALCFGVARPALHKRKWNGMETDERLNALLLEAAGDLGHDLGVLDSVPFLSEATEYLERGIPATLLMPDVRELPYYHTSEDTVEHVDMDRVYAVVEILATAVTRLDLNHSFDSSSA